MIPYGLEFRIAQFISAVITCLSLVYMIKVSLHDRKWANMTLAVFMLFISTIMGFMREFLFFNLFRTIEWTFIVFATFLFFYATFKSNRKLEANL